MRRIDWKAKRIKMGIPQREAERRMGWAPLDPMTGESTRHGRLSLIEQGVRPRPDEERDLRAFYGLEVRDAAAN